MLNFDFYKLNIRYLSAGFLLTFAASIGQTFYIALFANDIRNEIGLSHGAFGGVYTIATLMSAFTMLWLGKTVDIFKTQYLALAVLVCLSLSSFFIAHTSSFHTLVIAIFLLRLFGQGMSTHVAMTFMAKTFTYTRGKAISVSVLGRAAGEMFLPVIAILLISKFGWRSSWTISGFFILLLIIPLCFYFLRVLPVDDSKKIDRLVSNKISVKDYNRIDVAKDKLFYILMLGVLAPAFIITGIFFHSMHLLEIKNWRIEAYAYSMPLFSLSLIVSVLFSGWAVDRWSAVKLLPLYLIPLAIGVTILSLGSGLSTIYYFMFFAGMTTGLSTAITGALWAELYGIKYLGSIKSMVMAYIVASTAIAPGLMGFLIDIGIGIESQIFVFSIYIYIITTLFLIVKKKDKRLQ
jgi:MFS family permease